jgi:FtsH-binding integral membrane protein
MQSPEGLYLPTPIGADARSQFVTRTYVHLMGAITAFTMIEIYLFKNGLAAKIAQSMLGVSWLLVLGGFVVVSWAASRIAHTVESLPAQYAALGVYVLAEALIFVPILYIAEATAPGMIKSAAALTLFGFAGLTAIAIISRRDFSFLRGILMWGGVIALVLIVGGALFGFQLGTFFSVAMIALAGASILYDTSNILHHFPEDRYVAASLQLFASVALMFWYVLRLLSRR